MSPSGADLQPANLNPRSCFAEILEVFRWIRRRGWRLDGRTGRAMPMSPFDKCLMDLATQVIPSRERGPHSGAVQPVFEFREFLNVALHILQKFRSGFAVADCLGDTVFLLQVFRPGMSVVDEKRQNLLAFRR